MTSLDTLKQAAQALRDTKPELSAALEAMAEMQPVGQVLTAAERLRGDLRVGPFIWFGIPAPGALLYAAPIATPEQEPDGYIHPDNVRRLQAGETVAFRRKPYAHDGGGIPVFVGNPVATSEHDAKVSVTPKAGEHWLVKMPHASAPSEHEVVELGVSAIRLQELPMRSWPTPTWYALADIQLVECLKSTGADHAK